MDTPQAAAPAGWEYMVIHLNVEPGPGAAQGPAKPAEGAPAPEKEGAPAKPVFSESFLKKEFPQFYENRPAQERSGQPQHPAQQLQTFLNGQGSQGWELIGLFPVGALSMLFFRRPRRPPPPASANQPAATPVAAAAPPVPAPLPSRPTSAAEPAPAPAAQPSREATLEAVLARLTALEQRLPAAAPLPSSASGSSSSRRRPGGEARASGRRRGQASSLDAGGSDQPAAEVAIGAAQLRRLAEAEPPMPSSAAALAIGLRSAASLANHGARHGFRPGLCKHGPNGQVAVYVGPGSSDHGGKPRRLWIVVPADRLQG